MTLELAMRVTEIMLALAMVKINANQYVNTNINRANNKNDSGLKARVKRTAQPATTHALATSEHYTHNYYTDDDEDEWSPQGLSQYKPAPYTVHADRSYVSHEKRLPNTLQTSSRQLSTSTAEQGVSRVTARNHPDSGVTASSQFDSDAIAKSQPDIGVTGHHRSWIYESRTENKPRRDRTQLQTETDDTSCCRCTIL